MRHTHQYVKVKLQNGAKKAKCAIAGCSHYIPIELAVGRNSICNICKGEFVLQSRHFKNTKIHCDNCFKKKDTTAIIAKLLGEEI